MDVLDELIGRGEGLQLDFKHTIDDQKKIARTIVAFANSEGGSLLIGVKDNGKIIGVDPEEETHMIEGAVELYCFPKVQYQVSLLQHKHKLVLMVKIEKSQNILHKAIDENGNKKEYLRIADKTVQANKVIASYLRLKLKGMMRPEVFDDETIMFLKLFRDDEIFTLSKLYRNSTLSKSRIDQLLPQLIYWNIVEFKTQESGIGFSIKKEVEEN